jgi:hypothetical protein
LKASVRRFARCRARLARHHEILRLPAFRLPFFVETIEPKARFTTGQGVTRSGSAEGF